MDVVFGIGGSDDAFRALETIIERTGETGDSLTVAVLENPETDVGPDAVESRVRERLAGADLDATIERLEGEPGGELVAFAEAGDFDAIALGGGERTAMGKVAVGHIAEFVILNAPMTVILLR